MSSKKAAKSTSKKTKEAVEDLTEEFTKLDTPKTQKKPEKVIDSEFILSKKVEKRIEANKEHRDKLIDSSRKSKSKQETDKDDEDEESNSNRSKKKSNSKVKINNKDSENDNDHRNGKSPSKSSSKSPTPPSKTALMSGKKENGQKSRQQSEVKVKNTSTKKSKQNQSSYFLYLMPDESGKNYCGDTETVQYTIKLTRLPGTILDWFKDLWASKEHKKFITETLGVEEVFGLNATYDDECEEKPEVEKYQNNEDLFKYLCNNINVEKKVLSHAHSLIVSHNVEFDRLYAFFEAEAVNLKELGKYLQPLVSLDENGDVKLNP